MFAGCARFGGRFTLLTEIVNDALAEPPQGPLVPAATLTLAIPASENPGARLTLPVADPVPGDVVVTVTYVGPDTFANVIGLPSGSVAVSVWFAMAPSFTDMLAGWLREGGWDTQITATVNDLLSLKVPSLAVTETEAVPASENPGATL